MPLLLLLAAPSTTYQPTYLPTRSQHGAAAAAAASEFVTLSDELGLVMFKDVLAAEPPAAYGKLIGQLEEQV